MFLSILLISYRDFGILIDLVVYLTEYLGKIDQSLQTGLFKILASVGVTPRTKQLGVTPRTPLFEGKNPENQKTKISIKKGRLLLVNDQGFSQIRPT